MGKLIGISLPDDDPDLHQFLRDSKPAFDLAATILDKEHYLPPYPPISYKHRANLPRPIRTNILYGTWLAYATAQIRYWDEPEQAVETLNTLYKVTKLTRNNTVSFYETTVEWTSYYKRIQNLIRESEDPTLINNIEKMLQDQTIPFDDMQHLLHHNLVLLDEALMMHEIAESYGKAFEPDFEDHIDQISLQNTVHFIRQDLPNLQILADQPLAKVQQWLKTSDWDNVFFAGHLDSQIMMNIASSLTAAHIDNAMHQATLLAINIERYQKDLGRYPNTLNDLIPGYLSEISDSPATQKPYVYQKQQDFYLLSEQPIQRLQWDGKTTHSATYRYVEPKDFPE
jgi:hypothetical protein